MHNQHMTRLVGLMFLTLICSIGCGDPIDVGDLINDSVDPQIEAPVTTDLEPFNKAEYTAHKEVLGVITGPSLQRISPIHGNLVLRQDTSSAFYRETSTGSCLLISQGHNHSGDRNRISIPIDCLSIPVKPGISNAVQITDAVSTAFDKDQLATVQNPGVIDSVDHRFFVEDQCLVLKGGTTVQIQAARLSGAEGPMVLVRYTPPKGVTPSGNQCPAGTDMFFLRPLVGTDGIPELL